jgi:hypothetical protein
MVSGTWASKRCVIVLRCMLAYRHMPLEYRHRNHATQALQAVINQVMQIQDTANCSTGWTITDVLTADT